MSRRAGNLPLRSSFPLPSKRGRCAQRSEPAAPPRPYDRRTELTRILPLWPHELNDASPEGRRRVLGKLRRALGAERRRGITGHWTYDLARHAELLRVYRLELAASGGNRE
ncbi:MAG TPA: hypothetical protein VG758_31045 [Hyphomicrobiaceae bacterium]|jgi:hypothetical protein|nr:hypothetical protein [Hyphomicrobiaceae bacterium]